MTTHADPISRRRTGSRLGTLARHVLTLTGAAALGVAGLTAGLAAVLAPAPALAQSPKPDAKKVDAATATKKDQLIFKSGRQVDGVILEETETTVRMLVIFSDTLRSETTFQKSEILEIKRDAFKPDPAKDKKGEEKDKDKKADDKPADAKKDTGAPAPIDPSKLVDVSGKPVPPGVDKVYLVTFGGEFGRDLTRTPLKQVMDEIVKVQPDIVIVRFDHAFSQHGEEKVDWSVDYEQYDELEIARQLDTLLMDRVDYGGEFKKKPRMVAWVNKALGGAAFLPFTFREIYYTSDGRHGGLGAIELLLAGIGDEVVRQKQYSLRIARAVGLCEKGGHDKVIMQAMSLARFILSYRVVNGKVEFLEDMPPTADWFLLKDDGAFNEAHRDSAQDLVRLKGNDILTLDAKTAFDIGFSNGTADTVEELLSKMGVTRGYAVIKNTSREVLSTWSREVGKAEDGAVKLIRQYQSVEVKAPGGFKERTAARTQRKNLLRQVQSVVGRYAEAINPRRLGVPEQLIGQIDVVIDRIETEQRLDRPDRP